MEYFPKSLVFWKGEVLSTCYPVESAGGTSSKKNLHQFFSQRTPTHFVRTKVEEELLSIVVNHFNIKCKSIMDEWTFFVFGTGKSNSETLVNHCRLRWQKLTNSRNAEGDDIRKQKNTGMAAAFLM